MRYLLLASLSSRPVEPDRCSLNFLTSRYSAPNRLAGAPPFEQLKGLRDGHASYGGGLIVLDLTVEGSSIDLEEILHCGYDRKLQHAAVVGERLVLCFEDQLAVYPSWRGILSARRLDGFSPVVIDDPWFAGLHTVFAEDERYCVVSSSAADAFLRVDLDTSCVVSRRRLPFEIYGSNYTLSSTDSLQDHFINNDLQLGHLNCASPGHQGEVWVSTLIQGDVGHFDRSGAYRLLCRGFVGAHGARCENEGKGIYFADSCLGLLVKVSRSDGRIQRYQVDSRWLHDVQQLCGDVFVFAAADRNKLWFENILTGNRLLTYEPSPGCGFVQFVNVFRYA